MVDSQITLEKKEESKMITTINKGNLIQGQAAEVAKMSLSLITQSIQIKVWLFEQLIPVLVK